MTDSMIERVARAIWVVTPDRLKGNGANAWKMYIDEARAAIEAMREPTEAMLFSTSEIIAGFSGDEDTEYLDEGAAEAAWLCMIDVALSEKPK